MRRLRLVLLLLLAAPLPAAPELTVAWSRYPGFEPWGFAQQSGILQRWAANQGISIKLQLVDSYRQSLELFSTGKLAACAMTNVDALIQPAARGVESSVILVGDFSNGNDGLLLKQGRSVAAFQGRRVRVPQGTVSQYLLLRALALNRMKGSDIQLVATAEPKFLLNFATEAGLGAAVRAPLLAEARRANDVALVFDSSRIPGEIIDLMAVRSDAPEGLKRALVGAWFEVMGLLSGPNAEAIQAQMAESAGSGVEAFRAQMQRTAWFQKPAAAETFARGILLQRTMEDVRAVCAVSGLLPGKDKVGIQFPDGSIQGSKGNVKLRFDATYLKLAAEGKL